MFSLNMIRALVVVIFFSLYAVIYVVTTDDKDKRLQEPLQQEIAHLENNYNVTTDRFKIISDNVYNTLLMRPELLELFYRAKQSESEEERVLLRKKLYGEMRPHYERLNKLGVNIILFSFENNRTFLRIHKPEKFNDDLSVVRYSFAYVNANRKSIRGFEQGKISHAFRNIFPLYYKGEYIGSADVSFSSEIMQENMMTLHDTDTHFILDKSIFETNIWKAQKKVKYIQSIEHEGFLFAVTNSRKNSDFAAEKNTIVRVLTDEIRENIGHGEAFSLYYHTGDHGYVIAFLPIKNIKENKTVAYLVSYTDNSYLASMLNEYLWINAISVLLLLLFAFVIYNNIKQRLSLEIEVDRKTKDLQVQKHELEALVGSFDKNVIFSKTDLTGRIVHASEMFCKVSGYRMDELLTHPHNIVRHPDMPSSLFKELWDTLESLSSWSGEIKNRRKDGSFYWLTQTIRPDFNYEGKLIGYYSVSVDITAQKELEAAKEKAEEATRAKSDFLSNMSHELRTPLNAIIGFSQLLKKRDGIAPKERSFIETINTSGEHLLKLINSILDFSKIEAGEIVLEHRDFNLRRVIENVVNQLSFQADEKKLYLHTHYEENAEINVCGDTLRITQILTNLVSNALKFTHEGGIDVSVKKVASNRFRFEVQDSGIGLSPQHQAKLFQPFSQADGSTTRKYGGTGLGLSISKKLVELMNGRIWIESEEGKGSRFIFEIELAECETLREEAADEEPIELLEAHMQELRGRVLMVEDNLTNQLVITSLLEDYGIEIEIANNGQEAVDMFTPDRYALILMDLQMPIMNGYEASRRIRELDREIPIIALTANVMNNETETTRAAGMNAYLHKPVEVNRLLSTLIKYMG